MWGVVFTACAVFLFVSLLFLSRLAVAFLDSVKALLCKACKKKKKEKKYAGSESHSPH
jgi:hypothetical protein